jgi:hypothetical protein
MGVQNKIGYATHLSIGNFVKIKKIYTFRGQIGENKPSEPKNRRVVWYIDRKFYVDIKKTYAFRGRKGENRPQSPKTEFGFQNQYGRVIYPSYRNLIKMKKIYAFRGWKGEIRAPESKTEFVLQNLYCCVISLSIGFLYKAIKNILLGVKNAKIRLQQKKILGLKIRMVVWYIHRSGTLYRWRKYTLLGVKKA